MSGWGRCGSGEGSDDHEELNRGLQAPGGAQQLFPRTRPCLPVCYLSKRLLLSLSLPAAAAGLHASYPAQVPRGTARRAGVSCPPPAPPPSQALPGGSEGVPITCQPGHCDAAGAPRFSPSQTAGSPSLVGPPFLSVRPSPVQSACPQHPVVMLVPTPPSHEAAVVVFSSARPEAHLANGSPSPSQADAQHLQFPG